MVNRYKRWIQFESPIDRRKLLFIWMKDRSTVFSHLPFSFKKVCVWVCCIYVCVCVFDCEWERERESVCLYMSIFYQLYLSFIDTTHTHTHTHTHIDTQIHTLLQIDWKNANFVPLQKNQINVKKERRVVLKS